MFSETPDDFGNDPPAWVVWTFATELEGGGGGGGVDRTGICPVEKASYDGKGGLRLLGDMARTSENDLVRWKTCKVIHIQVMF